VTRWLFENIIALLKPICFKELLQEEKNDTVIGLNKIRTTETVSDGVANWGVNSVVKRFFQQVAIPAKNLRLLLQKMDVWL